MRNCLQTEWWRVTHSRGFWISLLLGFALTISHFVQHVWLPYHDPQQIVESFHETSMPNLFNSWIGINGYSQGYLFFLLLPVLAALPLAASFAADRSSGAVRQMLLNSQKRKHYFAAKSIAVFLAGGLCAVLPLAVNFLLTAVVVPAQLPVASTSCFSIFSYNMWADLFYSHPWVYTLLYMALIFVFMGLFVQLALCVSFFIKNQVAVLFSPLIVYLFIEAACQTLGQYPLSPKGFLFPGQVNHYFRFSYIAAEMLLLVLCIWLLFIRKGCHEDIV